MNDEACEILDQIEATFNDIDGYDDWHKPHMASLIDQLRDLLCVEAKE